EDVDLAKQSRKKSRAWTYIVIVGAAFSIGLFFIGRYTAQNRPAPRLSDVATKSIAVLPFVNMSADKNDEYLSDGVSEELITADVDLAKQSRKKSRAWTYIVIVGAAFSIGLFFIGRYTAQNRPAPRLSDVATKSIAVLPFVNMSADKNDEYLSDGVSEELIT